MSIDDIMRMGLVDLVRKQTNLTPEQDRAVKRLAERHHTTEAATLRRALDDLPRREGVRDGEDPFAALIGSIEGPAEVDHDDVDHRSSSLRLTTI
jgi:hypothetical protein